MIADLLSNNKLNPVVTELFIEVEKNISITFTALLFCAKKILEFYSALRTILLWKFQTNKNFNKLHLIIHQILTLKTLWIFTKKHTAKPYSFLVIDATLASDNPLRFRKNLSERI